MERLKRDVKMKFTQDRLIYVYETSKIKTLLGRSFKDKKKIKIKYYSLSSDQITYRIVNIYQLHKDRILAYCNLRKEERTFVINRIRSAAILDEKYKVPKNWSPESIILN